MSDGGPAIVIGGATLYCGDSRQIMPYVGLVDAIITDPPYGETSLAWDACVDGWLPLARATLRPHGSLWCFGSMRFFLASGGAFAGWHFVQDVVWEKHNGSSFHADRFRRVHEHALQFRPAHVRWADVYKNPVTTPDAARRTIRRKQRPHHTGHIERWRYTAIDGGPRLMRSVIYARSCQGYAIHPTQKPLDVLRPLVQYSVPPDGIVGDWFMGSGSLAIVALQEGRRYIGCEIDPAMFEAARRRIEWEFAHPRGRQLELPEVTLCSTS